jgi:hypothetical protein
MSQGMKTVRPGVRLQFVRAPQGDGVGDFSGPSPVALLAEVGGPASGVAAQSSARSGGGGGLASLAGSLSGSGAGGAVGAFGKPGGGREKSSTAAAADTSARGGGSAVPPFAAARDARSPPLDSAILMADAATGSSEGSSPPTMSGTHAPPHSGPAPERTLDTIGVAVVTFAAVTGGAFGIETAVGAAGALPTLLGLLFVGCAWSLPQALMTAELGALFASNGG